MLSIVLGKGTDVSIQKELSQDPTQQELYLNDLWLRIQREDKFLANFIKNFSAQSEDPAATIYACALVWRLLEAQEQANATTDKYNGGYL